MATIIKKIVTLIHNLTAWDTMEHFDKLCGFKNYYVPCYLDKENKPAPIHSFKDDDPATAFTRKELLRSTIFGLRAGFNNIFILDTDYKKNDGASDIPERFRNTYTDETKGGKHYIYIIPQGIPSYWGLKRGEHGTPYGADLFPTKNNYCVMTNSIRPKKYYRNITYMPPQPIPQELFNELDNFYKKNKKPDAESKENSIKVLNEKREKVKGEKLIPFAELEDLYNFCPVKYFDDGVLWNMMGWVLHYETNGSKEGYDLFVKCSRKPEKYKDVLEEVYINFWNNANKNNTKQVTIGSVFKKLQEDNLYYVRRIDDEFDREYFDSLRYTGGFEEKQKIINKIKVIDEAIKVIENNQEIKATIKRSKIKVEKDKKKDLKDELESICDEIRKKTYKYKKKYFELFHFKLRSPMAYGIISFKELIYYTKKNLKDYYENLYISGEDTFVDEWLKDRYIKTYKNVDFLPLQKCRKDTYNLFNGFRINKIDAKPAPRESIDIILNHMKKLTGGTEECFNYFLKYFAQMVQQPYKKPLVAIVLKSEEEGVGKNLFLEAIYNVILGKDYGMFTADQQDIIRRFNTSYKKFMIGLDEAKGKDSFTNSDKLKSRITCNDFYMEMKGFQGKNIADYARIFFNSNNRTPVKIGLHDRRFVVYECIGDHANKTEYFKPLAKALYDDSVMKTFYNYLMDIDINDFDPINDRPITKYYKELQNVNIPPVARYLCYYVDNEEFHNNNTIIKEGGLGFYEKFIEWKTSSGFNGNVSNTAFGRDIKHYEGIKKKRSKQGVKYSIEIITLKMYLISKGFYETLEYDDDESDSDCEESKFSSNI